MFHRNCWRLSASTLRPFLTKAQIAESRLSVREGVRDESGRLLTVGDGPSTAVAAAAAGPESGGALERAARRYSGKLVEWNSFTHRGVVVDDATGREYTITSPRAFETVLPTALHSIKGARVTYTLSETPVLDRVIIRRRGVRLTERDYKLKPPVDFLNFRPPDEEQERAKRAAEEAEAELQRKREAARQRALLRRNRRLAAAAGEPVPPSAAAAGSSAAGKEEPQLYVANVVVDLSSVAQDQLVRLQGYHPLLEEEAPTPPLHLKDMRSSRVLDRETNEYLRLRKVMGAERAREVMRLRQEEAARMRGRTVLAESVEGVVVAWSSIHRSGIVVEGSAAELDLSAPLSADAAQPKLSIIRGVHSFETALPTSKNLLHRSVNFTKVRYGGHPDKQFAESIVVLGDTAFDAGAASIEEARLEKQRERERLRAIKTVGAYFPLDETGDSAAGDGASNPGSADSGSTGEKAEQEGAAPPPLQYGVVTRWSGGQGTLEGSDGRVYYIRSGSDFLQLVDHESRTVRGAVVSFRPDQQRPRFARDIDVLSVTALPRAGADTEQQQQQQSYAEEEAAAAADGQGEAGAQEQQQQQHGTAALQRRRAAAREAALRESEREAQRRRLQEEPTDVEWREGVLLSWSPEERQGIVHGDDGVRYVLRDAAEDVIRYAERKPLLKNGRRVKFSAYGGSGRLACHVVPLDTEADEAELRAQQLEPKQPRLTPDGNPDEAIASPMSTDYWIARMERSGFDVSEVRARQTMAATPPEEDEDGNDPFLDVDDLFKKDAWFNDPSKNRKLPNSDVTLGQISATGPASMMSFALKVADPVRRDKMAKKYASKLTEEQKEYAYAQAKMIAPKYEEQIRKARERSEEPSFYFY